MRLVRTVEAWRRLRVEAPPAAGPIGFVPTLGGLHAGHEALLKRSLAENGMTVLSVFLNPTQFDRQEDLSAYPASFDADRELARKLGVDVLFCPTVAEIYPYGYRYRVTENELSRRLCGAHRPGHFDGVLTVVLKLLQLVRPRRAYFGEKDYQQLELVRAMAADFFLDVEIVACPTVRDADGLAVSSRNRLLSAGERRRAAEFPALLRSAGPPDEIRRRLETLGFTVDYVEESATRRFGAVRLGDVRLIDNVPLAGPLEGAA